jgi:hypothetical protein
MPIKLSHVALGAAALDGANDPFVDERVARALLGAGVTPHVNETCALG